MNNIITAQIHLLKWFKHFATEQHNLAKIKRLYTSFAGHLFKPEKKNKTFYQVFMPLVRLGLVEFCGAGKYQISPPIFLEYEYELLGVNLPPNVIKELKEGSNTVQENDFGILIMPRKEWQTTIKNYAKKHQIPFQKGQTKHDFKNFLPIKNLIAKHWQQIEPPKHVADFFGWTDWQSIAKKKQAGVYRAESQVYANRYFFDGNEKWYSMATENKNPDAFNIAVTAGLIYRDQLQNISYNPTTGDLQLYTFFPILLERLLHRQTLNRFDFSKKYHPRIVQNIAPIDFKQLNKIFHHQIQII